MQFRWVDIGRRHIESKLEGVGVETFNSAATRFAPPMITEASSVNDKENASLSQLPKSMSLDFGNAYVPKKAATTNTAPTKAFA